MAGISGLWLPLVVAQSHDSPVGLKQEDLINIDADGLQAVHLESQQKEKHQQRPSDHK